MVMNSIKIDNAKIDYVTLRKGKSFLFKRRIHTAIESISLEIEEGETVAVLGHNGAGKTTLLNFMAGKIRPSRGSAEIMGNVIHLAGVNPGFDPNISSRENVLWLSKVYGVDPNKTLHEVEEFSDLGESFDRPVKELSGGMKGRVGFGFATSLDPRILLIDEVLGVGDPSFKAKATERLKMMIQSSGIVVISTHSVGLVKELATRTIVLKKGVIVHDGDVQKGLGIYSSMHNQ